MRRQMKHNMTNIAAISLFTAAFALAPNLSYADSKGDANAGGGSTKSATANGAGSGDKLDVSGLENKYWAAKDTDFNVVQNRVYSKTNRFALSGSVGTLLNDPWTTGTAYNLDLTYYFSERWGLQLSYDTTNSSDNQAVQRLVGQLGYPDHDQTLNFYGAQVEWVPFYAKMSVLNWTIIYFDLQFGLGAGMQTYGQQEIQGTNMVTTPALTFDVTQNFFLNKYFALRVDLSNRWFNETTVRYNLVNGTNPSNGTSLNNATFLLLGLTVFY